MMDRLQCCVAEVEHLYLCLVRHTHDNATATNMEWVMRYADRLHSLADDVGCLAGRVLQANELHPAPPE